MSERENDDVAGSRVKVNESICKIGDFVILQYLFTHFDSSITSISIYIDNILDLSCVRC